jgi:hypothetical protein
MMRDDALSTRDVLGDDIYPFPDENTSAENDVIIDQENFHFVFPADDVPTWAMTLNANLALIYTQNARILATHEQMLAAVNEAKPTVMEVVNGLQSNPMLKMFMGGKK